MHVCLHKNYIGSDLHLHHNCDDGSFKWLNDVPNDSWVLGFDHSGLNILDLIFLLNKDIHLPKKQDLNMFTQLGIDVCDINIRKNIRWQHSLTRKSFEEYIRYILNDVCGILKTGVKEYYKNIFTFNQNALNGLDRCKINNKKFNVYSLSQTNKSVLNALESFRPCDDGFAKLVKYDQFSTKTGRLKVVDGPQILTLKKKFRNVITSRYDGGKIVMLDYISLEARVGRSIIGDIKNIDIYDDIAKNLFNNDVDRKTVKMLVLPFMFGASRDLVSKNLGISLEKVKEAYKLMIQYFGINMINKKLQDQFSKTDMIYNHYGRPLYPATNAPHILYNNFIQSTGADVSLLGFNNIIAHIKKENYKIRAVFIIHDCVMLDFHPDDLKHLDELKLIGSKIKGFNVPFYMKEEYVG
jgi:hypothetical protein